MYRPMACELGPDVRASRISGMHMLLGHGLVLARRSITPNQCLVLLLFCSSDTDDGSALLSSDSDLELSPFSTLVSAAPLDIDFPLIAFLLHRLQEWCSSVPANADILSHLIQHHGSWKDEAVKMQLYSGNSVGLTSVCHPLRF